jgi:hypothetical protein
MSWFCIRYTPFARASAVVISGWTGPKRQVVSRSSPAGHRVGQSPCGNYKQITETERVAPVCRSAKDRSTRFMNSTRRKYPTEAVYMTPKRTQGGPISEGLTPGFLAVLVPLSSHRVPGVIGVQQITPKSGTTAETLAACVLCAEKIGRHSIISKPVISNRVPPIELSVTRISHP